MLLQLATVLAAQTLDLATFSVMVGRHGIAAEANPVVNELFLTSGLGMVAAVKLLLIVLVGALAVAAWSRGGRGVWALIGAAPVTLAIVAGLLGGFTNAVAYLT